jgi:Ribbon-helix-helix protein, copG family
MFYYMPYIMTHETPSKTVGRPALGKQRVQLTLSPDVDALLDQLSKDMHEDRSTIVKEAIIKYSEEIYRRFTWQNWYPGKNAEKSAYFRFSRTVTITSEDGSQSISGPIHLLIKVDRITEAKDEKSRAMEFMKPYWGDIEPNAGLLIEIPEIEVRKAHALKPLAVHRDGSVLDVEWR